MFFPIVIPQNSSFYSIQFSGILTVVQPSPLTRIFSSLHKETLYLLVPYYFPSTSPTLGNRVSTFCLYRFAYSGDFIEMESYHMWPFI